MAISLGACTSSKKVSDIPYTEASNYYMKGNVTRDSIVKISSKESFNQLFGMATTMGANAKPTSIDFNNEFLIGILHPATDSAVKWQMKYLRKSGSNIQLGYEKQNSVKNGLVSKPFLLLIVDKKYNGNIEIH